MINENNEEFNEEIPKPCHYCGQLESHSNKCNRPCDLCGETEKHSDRCQSCFEFVRHQNLKDGLCRYCRMKSDDPEGYAEARHFGYVG